MPTLYVPGDRVSTGEDNTMASASLPGARESRVGTAIVAMTPTSRPRLSNTLACTAPAKLALPVLRTRAVTENVAPAFTVVGRKATGALSDKRRVTALVGEHFK